MISLLLFVFSFTIFLVVNQNVNRLVLSVSYKMYLITSLLLVLACSLSFMPYISSSIGFVFFSCYLSPFNYYVLVIVYFVSVIILLNSVDYLSIIESLYFMLLLLIFVCSMLLFLASSSLLILFVAWELLGIMSYLLINFWSTKSVHGIKAVVYNKVGDVMFLLLLGVVFNSCYSFSLASLFVFKVSSLFMLVLILFTLFSKSAMLPFSSWLIFAMAAPTPVSSLLHSSTMVIAGVYLGLLLSRTMCWGNTLALDLDSLLVIAPWFIIIFTLLYSCLMLLFVSDIKSLVAYSTLNQLAYLFVGLFSCSYSFLVYHIIVHALFKSCLFLLCGSLIHVSSNYQSLFRLSSYSLLVRVLFIASLFVNVINFSKECIIVSLSVHVVSSFLWVVCVFGVLVSLLYSLKLYVLLFGSSISSLSSSMFSRVHNSDIASSYLFVVYAISVLFVDYWFYGVFSVSSFVSLPFSVFVLVSLVSVVVWYSRVFLWTIPRGSGCYRFESYYRLWSYFVLNLSCVYISSIVYLFESFVEFCGVR